MQVDEKDLLQILKQLKILLVDDNPVYQDSIKNVLLNFSDNITISDNGIDAFEQYKSCKPDIIVTDIEMPKMNGLELVKKIREDDDRTSIIILTSFLSEDYLLSAANLDIQGYMQKALDIKKLKALLLKAAKKHANEQIVKIDIKDGLVYDKSAGTLITNNDVANELNKKEKALLEILLENKKNPTSYFELEQKIWTANDEVMTLSALRTLATHLRKKSPIKFIKNISGSGYIIN